MEKITINGKDKELKFTFNSFKYMQDFNVDDFDGIEKHPFKLVPIVIMLLMGALNYSPLDRVSEDDVIEFLDGYSEDGDVSELMTVLMDKLQDASFFKSLQKKAK